MIDAHNHLHFAAFDDDRDETLRRAARADVEGMVLAGYDSSRRDLAASLARRPGIWATAGVHPWALSDLDDQRLEDELCALETLDWRRFVGLGELGLDRTRPELDRQKTAFRRQLALAREQDLPIVIHSVRTNSEVLEVLKRDGVPPAGGIVHSFWGSPEEATALVEVGLYLSIGTQITKKAGRKVRDGLLSVGLGRLMVETDSPSRPPEGVEAKRNEPAHLSCVVRSLALLLREEEAHVARTTATNAREVFRLPTGEAICDGIEEDDD